VTSSSDLPPPTPPAIAAAAVCLVEALALVVTALVYGLELADGRAVDASTASMSLVVCLIFAILLAVLAAAWRKSALWPRTPTLVWNVLLLPAAWTLTATNGIWVGLALAVVAVAGVVASLLAPSADLTDRAL
jgi:K+-sensing histidine kinase KdpD